MKQDLDHAASCFPIKVRNLGSATQDDGRPCAKDALPGPYLYRPAKTLAR